MNSGLFSVLLADFDLRDLRPFLVVVFIVAAVVSQALAKGKRLLQDSWDQEPPRPPGGGGNSRSGAGPARTSSWVPPVPPPLPKGAGAWERELERILRGPAAVPPAPPPPPPSAPATGGWSRPVTFDYGEETDIESAPAPSARLASMTESDAAHVRAGEAYQIAGSLQQQVEERMRSVDSRVSGHTAAAARPASGRREPSSESAAVRSWLRQPDTARAAFVAAAVFGPPKALEQ